MATLEVEVDGVWLRERWEEFRRAFRERFEEVMTEEDLLREEERERLLIEVAPAWTSCPLRATICSCTPPRRVRRRGGSSSR